MLAFNTERFEPWPEIHGSWVAVVYALLFTVHDRLLDYLCAGVPGSWFSDFVGVLLSRLRPRGRSQPCWRLSLARRGQADLRGLAVQDLRLDPPD